MNETKMTLTERNQKLYDLREKMNKLETELAWVKQEIWVVNDQYKRQDLDLYTEMFGPDAYNERGQDSAFMDDNFGG